MNDSAHALRARERRNVSSLARGPSMADASAHSARASTCGHSSPHGSAVWPDRRRRSCATIASCHAMRRARSDAASVPLPEFTIAYGFISDSHLFAPRAPRSRPFATRPCFQGERPRRAGTIGALDVIPNVPMKTDSTCGRRGGRYRCRQALARGRPTGKDVDRRDSRLRHRPDEGWCPLTEQIAIPLFPW